MCYELSSRLRACVVLLCLALLLLCVSTAAADPKPLTKEEQAKIDQAIDKAVAKLKRFQTRRGDWPTGQWRTTYPVGQCALPAYALLEAGVQGDDPVVQKAAAFIRPKLRRLEKTYELSLAVLFLARLGDSKDKKLIQTLALRLIAGQHRTGGWNYRCPTLSAENETALLKLLEELEKQMTTRGKSRTEAVKDLDIPRALNPLTIFQDPRLLWIEPPPESTGSTQMLFQGLTDNSNTQFAMLALWVARRHGVPLEPTFRLMVERFVRSQQADGWWPYGSGQKLVSRSMICVGLMGLAIGRGLRLPMPGKNKPGEEDLRILKGLVALYQEVGIPRRQMKRTVPLQDYYFLWSVERVAMLYDLPTLGDKEWYRWGAESLVTNQEPGGEWLKRATLGPKDFVIVNYGPVLNTAFALLFLKHSHPMKELTPKLPFTAKELNQGIARLREADNQGIGRSREGDKLRGTTATSRDSKIPEKKSKKGDP